jgi:transposase
MIIIGIDPHKASHTAVAIDEHETVLSQMTTRSCRTQTQRLRSWAEKFEEQVWAVEPANGLGYLLAQQLVACGEQVVDVPPALAARTRVLGSSRSQKNDPNDARSVAVTALRQPSLQTVHCDDHAKVLKLTAKRHRDLGALPRLSPWTILAWQTVQQSRPVTPWHFQQSPGPGCTLRSAMILRLAAYIRPIRR